VSAAPSAGGAAAVAEAPKEEEKKVHIIYIPFLFECPVNVQSGVTIGFSINATHVCVKNVSGGRGSYPISRPFGLASLLIHLIS
jgi:hypothetical protein